jgi:hypothetical protein
MKKFLLSIALILVTFMSQAQVVQLSGPRVGGTIVTPGASSFFIQVGDFPSDDNWIANYKAWNPSSSFISQYGWQLETKFIDSEDIAGLVEWVFLVGGMEKGLFLPSVSSLFGMRTQSGVEAAFGPNLSLSGIAMVFALGITIKTGNLNIPINLSFVPGKKQTKEGYEEYINYDNYNDQGAPVPITVPGVPDLDYNTGSRISLTMGFNLAK